MWVRRTKETGKLKLSLQLFIINGCQLFWTGKLEVDKIYQKEFHFKVRWVPQFYKKWHILQNVTEHPWKIILTSIIKDRRKLPPAMPTSVILNTASGISATWMQRTKQNNNVSITHNDLKENKASNKTTKLLLLSPITWKNFCSADPGLTTKIPVKIVKTNTTMRK